ncbi:MAG: GGDEF domain-containing protein [Solirubrobacterales bacterium]|nr:GGDEF domain-containing protein [Solirubrobacterales bacterium]
MSWRSGHGLRKTLGDFGLRHSAKNAYRPMRRPGEPPILLTDERLRVHRNVFWFGAAFIYGITGVVTLTALVVDALAPGLNVPEEAFSTTTIAVSLVAMAMAAFWLTMAARNEPALPWMNAIIGIGTLLISVVALTSGEFGPIILPYLLAPAMAAAFYMPFKQAIGHLLLITAVMFVVAFSTSETENGKIVALNVWFFTMMGAAMLMVARKRIQDGIIHNVSLAGRDPLTGVANLRKFQERLRSEIDRSERSGDPLTLLMIDLDDFKRVNDEYSYTLGDAVLAASAKTMDSVVRANELLARRGGDEFAVIAVGADEERGEMLALRIREVVRRERARLCPDVSPEASVGVVQWASGETPENLIGRADAALKTAKRKAYSGDAEDVA